MESQPAEMAGTSPPPMNSLSDKVRSLRLATPESSGPEPGTSRLPWFLTIVLTCLIVYLGYELYVVKTIPAPDSTSTQQGTKSESGSVRDSSPATGKRNENALPATAAPGSVVLESKGYIIPAHQILVTPKVTGMVVKLTIEEGKRVKQGDVLAQLETTDYKADFDRVTATLQQARTRLAELNNGNRPEEILAAKAELDETVAQRRQLHEAYLRAIRLRENKTISVNEFEKAESDFRAMESRAERLKQTYDLMVKGPRAERIQLAQAEVQQSEADLVKAKWRLDNCTILAPITGTILTKKAEEGNVVNPIAFSGSQAVCEMADLSDLEVDLSIQERDVAKVFQGQKCIVRAEAYPERAYQGYVSRLMPIADRAKGAVPVRVKLTVPAEEEGVFLKPEMGAVVTFFARAPDAEKEKGTAPAPVAGNAKSS